MGRERAISILVALGLHAAAIALAMALPRPATAIPVDLIAPENPVSIRRLQRPPTGNTPAPPRRGARSHARAQPPAEIFLPEREIIDQGHGVIMTIEGGSSADAGVPEASGDSAPRGPPPAGQQWLRLEVWMPGPASAPRPSIYCAALEMPEQAVDREITGRVEVSYDVDADGVVTSVEADGPFVLARSVRRWLEGCLFEPSIQGGRRTAAHVKQAFVFRIR